MIVFIGYSSKDKEFVEKLSLKLVENKINVWLDKWEMNAGDSLIDKIQDGLEESSFLLVVLSENSIESEWCKKELNSGLMKELDEKRVAVIPIRIDDCKMPVFLREKLYADFRDDFDDGLTTLLKPLSKLFSETMGRNKSGNIVTDYCTNYGLNNSGLYELKIWMVSWIVDQNKSIVLNIKITGDDNATQRFLVQAKTGMNWLMKDSLISMMKHNIEISQIRMLFKSDETYKHQFKTKDEKLNLIFDIQIEGNMLGEDNGNDIIFDLNDYLEMLLDSIKRKR